MARQNSMPAHTPGFTAEQMASIKAMVTACIAGTLKRGNVRQARTGLLDSRAQDSISNSFNQTSSRKRKANVNENSATPDAKRSRWLPGRSRSLKDSGEASAETEEETIAPKPRMLLKYSYVCHLLPVAQALGYPHLINLKKFTLDTEKDNIRLPDIIGTILFHNAPGILDAFLDLKGYYVVVFTRIDSDGDELFCIKRQGGT